MSDANLNDVWRTVVEKSWADAQYRQALLDNPNKVLAAAGVEIPANASFVVVENEPTRLHLVLPAPPGEQLADSGGAATLSQYDAATGF